MKYGVKIPGWQMDKSLTIKLEAENESDAYQKAVDWVNTYAGFHYCDKLPVDTVVKGYSASEDF
jgi:hypothetical protein